MAKKNALEGFVDFIKEQGVVGLAVGVVLGAAAKDVVDALVNGVINPLIGLIFSAENLAAESFKVGDATIYWGVVVSKVISFVIVAAVVYFVLNKALAVFDKEKK